MNSVKWDKCERYFYAAALILLTIITGWLLFGYLGYPQVEQTDEAAHGINAYEMLQQGSVVVNYLKHEVDYFNSKPPLMLWFIMLSFKIFGPTPFALRLPSAIFGLILYLVLIWWTNDKLGKIQTIFWAVSLPTLKLLFDYHMLRSGDMDSLYTLLFTLAVIGLVCALKEHMKGAILYGLFGGLCFMTKGQHMYTLVLLGISFAPFLYKSGVKIKHYVAALLTGLAIILPWAVARYMFDGTKLFYALFVGETGSKVANGSALEIMTGFFKTPAVTVSLLICIFALIRDFLINKSFRITAKRVFLNPFRYVLFAWALIVLLCNFLIGIDMEWYIYSAYIPVILLGGDALAYLIRSTSKEKILNSVCIIVAGAIFTSFTVYSAARGISYFSYDKMMGGSPSIGFYYDNLAMAEEYSMQFSYCPAYIELSPEHVKYKEPTEWEIDYVFLAETTNDVLCYDGGVKAFLETDNMDAILYLDKCLWDQYSDVLPGHVILKDAEYYVLSKHCYGE